MPCQFELSILIVDPKEHKRAMATAGRVGFQGATIVYGRGTVANKILAALGMDSLRKELLLLVGHKRLTPPLHEALHQALHLEKHGHGVICTLPLVRAMGLHELDVECWKGDSSVDKDYELIIIVVDKGRSDDVIDAATAAGATGATVLHGRGSGAEKVDKFFNLEIEPEKELILIISPCQQAESIVFGIRSIIDFDAPNSGILFSLSASQVTGIFRTR